MSKPIVIEAEDVEMISVVLVGQEYSLRPPKASAALQMARSVVNAKEDPEQVVRSLSNWSRQAFGKKVGREVMARMDDPDDPLDVQHLAALIEAVVERQTGNPTTSRSDSA